MIGQSSDFRITQVQFLCLNQTSFCSSQLSYILFPCLECPFSYFPFKNVPLESCSGCNSLRETLFAPTCKDSRRVPGPAQGWGCWHVLSVLFCFEPTCYAFLKLMLSPTMNQKFLNGKTTVTASTCLILRCEPSEYSTRAASVSEGFPMQGTVCFRSGRRKVSVGLGRR